MKRTNVVKVWEKALLISLSITLCWGLWAQGRQNSISSSLVRLHVLAHSDAASEQALKLRVRDSVLEYIAPKLESAESRAQAQNILQSELEGIAAAAASAAEGRKVRVSLGSETYPTRDYEGFSLPAGSYESLQVLLGEAEGENWWCIVYPPVCLSAVQSEPVEAVMSKEDYALISNREGWQLRFKSVELWGELTAALRELDSALSSAGASAP